MTWCRPKPQQLSEPCCCFFEREASSGINMIVLTYICWLDQKRPRRAKHHFCGSMFLYGKVYSTSTTIVPLPDMSIFLDLFGGFFSPPSDFLIKPSPQKASYLHQARLSARPKWGQRHSLCDAGPLSGTPWIVGGKPWIYWMVLWCLM